jgi:hypothetical protein
MHLTSLLLPLLAPHGKIISLSSDSNIDAGMSLSFRKDLK